jgi:hypothetical protein
METRQALEYQQLLHHHIFKHTWNSSAAFMIIDLANFYLMTPLIRPEFAKIKLSNIPEEIIQE